MTVLRPLLTAATLHAAVGLAAPPGATRSPASARVPARPADGRVAVEPASGFPGTLRITADRAELVDLLRAEGLVGEAPTEDELVVAIHELLAASRSQLVLIAPYDVVGEGRQPNLPGTVDQYPNWRLPLPVTLDELRTHPVVAEVVSRLRRLR